MVVFRSRVLSKGAEPRKLRWGTGFVAAPADIIAAVLAGTDHVTQGIILKRYWL